MNETRADDVADRLRAWSVGRPLPRWSTRCVDLADDPLIVALLRVGGEGRPSAIAYGKSSSSPLVISVPDSREPRSVAEMVEVFGRVLLGEFPTDDSLSSRSQLLLPDRSHLELLHQMAYAYAFSKWPLTDMKHLNTVGRLLNSLFLQWQNPIQNNVLLASDALQSLYVYPASPARQGHLGFLLEWLVDHGSRLARHQTAMKAETRSVSTSLDGEFEDREISPLLRAFEESNRSNNNVGNALKKILEAEALNRWHLCRAAFQTMLLDPRPENLGLRTLRAPSRRAWNRLWVIPRQKELNKQRAYWRGTETEISPTSAAEEMMLLELASKMKQEALAHGDWEIALSLVRRGKAIHGIVISCKPQDGLLTIEYDNPDEVDFREGTTYRPFGTADLQVGYEDVDLATRQVHFSVEEGSLPFEPGDDVILIEYNPDFFVANKIRNMSQEPTTGLDDVFRRPPLRVDTSTSLQDDQE